MKFHFKAQKVSGEIFEGERESGDKFTLYDELKKEGATMLYAKGIKAKQKIVAWRDIATRLVFGPIPIHEKIIFAKNLSAMLEAGLPLSRALSVIERQIGNKRMKKLLPEINESIKKGMPLSEAMSRFPGVFSSLFTSIVRAGEEGGNLSESLKIITSQLERIYYIQRKLRGALIYPALIVCLIVVIGILMFIFVVPKLTSTFIELKVSLPWSTKILIYTSSFLKDHYIFVSVGAILLAVSTWIFMRTNPGRKIFHFIYLKFPLIGPMVMETNTARAARTLSSLLASGVNVIDSLNIAKDVVQNVYFKGVLEKASQAIQKGEPLSSPFLESEKIYPPFFAEMVAAGEETGNLSEMLSEVGVFYENEVEQKTKDFSTIIEPIIMIVIGSAVGFFALAMLTPMYSMMGSI